MNTQKETSATLCNVSFLAITVIVLFHHGWWGDNHMLGDCLTSGVICPNEILITVQLWAVVMSSTCALLKE